jgi:hypothetical protein
MAKLPLDLESIHEAVWPESSTTKFLGEMISRSSRTGVELVINPLPWERGLSVFYRLPTEGYIQGGKF